MDLASNDSEKNTFFDSRIGFKIKCLETDFQRSKFKSFNGIFAKKQHQNWLSRGKKTNGYFH